MQGWKLISEKKNKIKDLKHMEEHASFIVRIHFEGTVSVTSSWPSMHKDSNARFTTVPLKPLCFLRVQNICVLCA